MDKLDLLTEYDTFFNASKDNIKSVSCFYITL